MLQPCLPISSSAHVSTAASYPCTAQFPENSGSSCSFPSYNKQIVTSLHVLVKYNKQLVMVLHLLFFVTSCGRSCHQVKETSNIINIAITNNVPLSGLTPSHSCNQEFCSSWVWHPITGLSSSWHFERMCQIHLEVCKICKLYTMFNAWRWRRRHLVAQCEPPLTKPCSVTSQKARYLMNVSHQDGTPQELHNNKGDE